MPAAEDPVELHSELLADPDSVRELVHEIKTPLNAIIGFAEIIDGQYLGPADYRYRERAAEIVAQARILLTAIDDLDFAARVHSSHGLEARRANIGDLVERLAPSLREIAAARESFVDASRTTRDLHAVVEPELAERLITRTCQAMIEQTEKGEHLRLSVDRAGDVIRVSISRPAALHGISDDELFGIRGEAVRSSSLRLVHGLARVAGADLSASPSAITLSFTRA
jgi:signal transduction histidine kinase